MRENKRCHHWSPCFSSSPSLFLFSMLTEPFHIFIDTLTTFLFSISTTPSLASKLNSAGSFSLFVPESSNFPSVLRSNFFFPLTLLSNLSPSYCSHLSFIMLHDLSSMLLQLIFINCPCAMIFLSVFCFKFFI